MITLYHSHQTRSMRSLWVLNELGVDFETVILGFDKSLRAREHLARNPAGRVPALDFHGKMVFETGAITQVLCEAHPGAGLGRAVDDPERVDWLIWVHFSETLSQHGAALTQQHVALYEDHMRSPIVMKLEAKRLANCFAAVEARLSGRDTLLNSGFSAADISVGQAIYMCRHFVRLDPFARLTDWYDRITDRDGFRASLPPKGAKLLYDRDFYPPWDS